jgi:DNA-binding SARP family transcriptional activator/TolB-like protein
MIDLQLLGTTAIRDGDRPDLPHVLVQPKRLALFVYLTLATPGGFHRRDKLLALFWPERSDVEARAALSDALYFLRRRLGEDVILGRGSEEVGVAASEMRCDAFEFERALEEERFAEAVEVYAGDLLDGFHLSGLREFEAWLEAQRRRLRVGYGRALAAVAEGQEREGDDEAAIESWRRLLALDRFDSRTALKLIEALARSGRPAAALREAEAHADLLRSELGVEPPEDLTAIAARLRTGPVPVDAASVTAVPEPAGPGPPGPPTGDEDGVGANQPRGGRDGMGEGPARTGSHRTPRLLSSQGPRRHVHRIAVAGLALATVGVGVYVTLNGSVRPGQPPTISGAVEGPGDLSTTSVAVLPFAVRGGGEVAYLGEGLASLLSTKLDGAGGLRGVDSHTLLRRAGEQETWDPQEASLLAGHFGAGLHVLGSVVASGGRLHIDAALYEVGSHQPAVRAAVEGMEEELFALVDRLAVELLAARLHPPEAGLRSAADLTTHSLPALRAFLAGERERRAYRWSAAIEAYQQAIREDSTFALAHLRLSLAVGWSPPELHLALRQPAVEAALRHGDRLSRRDRLVLEALADGVRGRPEVEARLRDLTLRYPEDAEAWYLLGDLLFHANPDRGRSISEARQAFERAAALDPANRGFLDHLVHLALHERRFGDLDSLAERMGDARPPSWRTMLDLISRLAAGSPSERSAAETEISRLEPRAQMQLLFWTAEQGPAELLEALLDVHAEEPLALAPGPPHWPDWRSQGEAAQLAFWLGRLSEAEALLEGLRGRAPVQAVLYEAWWARTPFAPTPAVDLTRLRGQLQALPSDVSPWPTWDADVWRQVRLFLLGALSVRLGDFPEAERHAGALEGLAAPDLDGSGGYATDVHASLARIGSHTVRAMAAQAQGRTEEALRLLESVETEMFGRSLWARPVPHPDFTLQRFLRAELLRALGRDEEALVWYPYHGWSEWLMGPQFVPLSHLRIAEIHDRRGDTEAAIHHFTLFTLLWRDADPELRSLVEEAEGRLAVLRGARAATGGTVRSAPGALPGSRGRGTVPGSNRPGR